MSYEGYVQSLCAKGHYSIADCWEDPKCDDCDSPIVWTNSVDQTNDDDVGYIEMDFWILEKALNEVCNLGHYHQVRPAIYKIPTEEQTRMHQTYRDSSGEIKFLRDP